MKFLGEIRLQARLDSVRTVLHLANGIGQELNLTEKSLFDIELALEEAVVNIVRHAYSESTSGEFTVKFEQSVTEDILYITLTDWGLPFNEGGTKSFNVDAPVEERITGGMGLHFIRNLMDDVQREVSSEQGQSNRLILTKHYMRRKSSSDDSRSVRELNAMLNVSQYMTTGISLDDLLTQIVNQLVKAIGAERGTLYLVDEEQQELFSRVLMEDSTKLKEIRMAMGEGIAGKVAQTGVLLNVPDAYAHPDFNSEFDQIVDFRTRAILAVPITNRNQDIIGVVQVLNKVDGEFTTRDERLLTAMAAQAAISIENARLYEQEIQQQLINKELETAHRIQQSFLPDITPRHAGWDVSAYWRPMREVGGDFYDFYRLSDGRVAVLIADVSGKGIPAAMFMALSVTVLRFAMSLNFAPDKLMDRANQLLIADQKSRMFATVFAAYLDFDTGEMQYASAGHHPPILYRAATGQCEYLEAPGVAMGLFTAAEYQAADCHIHENDVLVMYTDGITEVLDVNDIEFGEDRLMQLIVDNAGLSADALKDVIMQAVTQFSSDQLLDDETLVVIKRL